MEWLEVSISTTSDGVEPVCALLMENNITGMEIKDNYDMRLFLENNKTYWDYADEALLTTEKGEAFVTFYISPDNTEAGRESLLAIETGLNTLRDSSIDDEFGLDFGALTLNVEKVDDNNWLDNWKKYYKPFTVGNNIVIKPSWEEYVKNPEKDEVLLTINPGHVFGTGLHQSTQLCIKQLEACVKKGDKVFDIGCGSGILSLISILLGAENALGVDIDPACISVAKENAELNQIIEEQYSVLCGNLLSDEGFLDELAGNMDLQKKDIVLSNIIADVIISLVPIIPRFIKKGGIYITSGIIKDREKDVAETLASHGFIIEETEFYDEWCCIRATYGGLL